jgi:alkanesulfonate monooxygenase SsuD/methylene tetrahydromethanopterin reductase-like flavin-dependent oxidoreductase (luciferase family)
VRTVRAALDEAGRDPATFRIAKRVYLTVDDDAERARRRTGEGLRRIYGYFGLPDLTPVSVTGPPAAVVDGLREVIAAGAELILLNPLFDDAEQLERLASEVVPKLA